MPKFKGLAGLAPPFIYRAAERFCAGVVAVGNAQLTLSFADDSGPYNITPHCSFVASDDEGSSEQLFRHH